MPETSKANLYFWPSLSENQFPHQNLLEALDKVGIKIESFNPTHSTNTITLILIFTSVTVELCRFLHDYSQDGINRVLAITLDPRALDNGEAWKLLKAGASDVLVWGEEPIILNVISARLRRWHEVDRVINSPDFMRRIIGRSPTWISALRQIVAAACFSDAPILLTGETGTGKEAIAHVVHEIDRRPNKRDLHVLDCTTIVPELSGSELFGHERGAFTGAISSREGAFELADGGTLFLDEIGELPLLQQVMLLRAIQEHTYKRVGSNSWRHTDFRLVCATNRDLVQEESQGRFRRDLYYRLASWVIRLPPLQERLDDIIPLTEYFMRQVRPGVEPPPLDSRVRDYLLKRAYPGNVRDLRNLVLRMMAHYTGVGPLTVGDIPVEERPVSLPTYEDWQDSNFRQVIRHAIQMGVGLKEIRRATEDLAITLVVNEENGNLQKAAKRLQVTDRTLQLRRAGQPYLFADAIVAD